MGWYAEFERKREEKKAEAQREREELGQVPGEKKDAMIQVSRATFGELTGKLVFCFEGWRLRWDYSSFSGQATKTYTEPSGREWKLLSNLECYFGHQLSKGGQAAATVQKLVDDARPLEEL